VISDISMINNEILDLTILPGEEQDLTKLNFTWKLTEF
jgi:hypothetical protein